MAVVVQRYGVDRYQILWGNLLNYNLFASTVLQGSLYGEGIFLTQPKLAILDEPDSGADSTTQQLIAETIKSMPETTFLFISHQPAFTDLISPTDTTTLSAGKIVIK